MEIERRECEDGEVFVTIRENNAVVTVDKQRKYGHKNFTVTINWSALGEVSIATVETYAAMIEKAIEMAKGLDV